MSDANEAWEEWAEAFDILTSQGVPIDRRTTFIAGHKAGFAAGQVAALEDAAEAYSVVYHKASAEAMVEIYDFLRARAAELSKEQHDQPDAHQ